MAYYHGFSDTESIVFCRGLVPSPLMGEGEDEGEI